MCETRAQHQENSSFREFATEKRTDSAPQIWLALLRARQNRGIGIEQNFVRSRRCRHMK
jgi:hypothetical protein